MPLMPADVANIAFSTPPIGKRGYHEGAVDAFLDLVQAELARLIEENTDLRNQVAQLDAQRRAAPIDTGNNLRPVGPPGPVIVPIRPPMREQTPPGGDRFLRLCTRGNPSSPTTPTSSRPVGDQVSEIGHAQEP